MLSSIMSVAILGSLLPARIPGVRRWMGANALAVVGLVLFSLQRAAPALLSILAANGIFAISIVLVLEGCRQFFGRRPSLRAAYAGCAAVLAGIAYWTWVKTDINARIVLVSAFHAWIYVAIGWTAWRGHPPGRPAYSYRFVTIASWLGALGHASRGVVYASGWEAQAALLQATPLNTAFLALGILAPSALTIGMVMLAHDRLAERLERFANFDELTGALTRRAFVARAEALLDSARRHETRLSIAIIDIDHFKTINDRYGHAAGDRVLARFGRLMTVSVRESDLFGRLGGEEFALLFPGIARDDALARVDAIRVKSRFDRRSHPTDDPDLPDRSVTFSAGVDEYRGGDTLADLMGRADAALYSAKTSGRDRVVIAA
ncbi:diguanylate cyclase (GGDEF)-like protein [Paraburkholderia caballeronis]|nr:diguanylate cyclase (GGDEF)-like protein [Paraburkholderia caballeronis]TDV22085.1 diguanylate cyclase (GGDEF)-like protein [Paraburkholderia caballeronis]TDV28989.1 diguanylate cyclase (GGDEF)-like protein [Paraburkholderia caballeronis]